MKCATLCVLALAMVLGVAVADYYENNDYGSSYGSGYGGSSYGSSSYGSAGLGSFGYGSFAPIYGGGQSGGLGNGGLCKFIMNSLLTHSHVHQICSRRI